MNVAEFVGRLAARTHPERAAAWDAVGLQVGDPRSPVRTTTVVHEVTEAVTEHLVAEPVDLVVSYHPLLFRPVSRLVADRSPAGRATRLVRAGVAVVVTHSDFDAMPGGMSDAMADALGLADIAGFAPMAAADQVKVVTFVPADSVTSIIASLFAAGAGHIGDYEECAFTVDGVGRFTAEATTTPSVGQAGRRNVEAETRVEMIAPARRTDAVVEALIATHPYEEPAFDVYPVASNHTLGGRLGTFAGGWDDLFDARSTTPSSQMDCGSVGPPTVRHVASRYPPAPASHGSPRQPRRAVTSSSAATSPTTGWSRPPTWASRSSTSAMRRASAPACVASPSSSPRSAWARNSR